LVRKFSASWFLAIHMSMPLIILLRVKMGLSAWFIPLTLGTAVAGQFLVGASGENREQRDQISQAG